MKGYGYSIVRLPKTDVKPLLMLSSQGKHLDRLGDLSTVLVAGGDIPLPPISENNEAASVLGKSTSYLKLGIGLSILGDLIAAMGGSNLGLSTRYQQAKGIAFEIPGVLEDKVEVALLDQYLVDADVNPFSRYAAQLLESDDLYVITATVKSKKFTVEAVNANGVALELGLSDIQGIIGGNVTVSSQINNASKLTYEGKAPLVFGFQCVRLFYENGRYCAVKPIDPSRRTAMRALEFAPKDGAERLVTESPLVRFAGE